MRHPVRQDRVSQSLRNVLLPDDIGKALRPEPAGQDGIRAFCHVEIALRLSLLATRRGPGDEYRKALSG